MATDRWYGWRILGVCSVALVATSPGQTYIVSLFNTPMQAELGLSASAMSMAYMVATLTSASLMTGVGIATDRVGPRRAMSAAAIGLAAASLWMVAVSNLLTLTIGFFLLRFFGQGSLALTSGHGLAMWFEQRLGTAEGIRLTTFGLGMAVLPAVVVGTIESVGWRMAWPLVGCTCAAVVLLLVLALHRDRPEDVGTTVDGVDAVESTVETPLEGEDLPTAMRTVVFWIVAANSMSGALIATAILFHLSVLATSPATLMTVFALVSTSLYFLSGYLADRLGAGVVFALAGGFIAASTSLFAVQTMPYVAMGALGAASALMSTTVAPTLARRFGRAHHGAIRGAVSTIGVAGTAVGPVILGLSMDLGGSPAPGLWGFAGFALLVGLAALVALRPVSP